MKKIIAMLLVLTLAMGLVACGNNAENTESTPETTLETTPETTGAANVSDDDETAVALLTAIWDNMDEDKKFFAMGGDMNNVVDNAPGAYSLEDEGLTATLLIPQEQIANVSEAASLVHAMMLNNFTCGAFKVTGEVNDFVSAMYTAVSTNRWMCGQPEKMAIAVIGEYVVVVFGLNDTVNPFLDSLTFSYPQAELDYNEAITG